MHKERPILFNAAMVRALLNGHKTQARRVMKPQPEPTPDDYPGPKGHWWPSNAVQSMVHIENQVQNGEEWSGFAAEICPYGRKGDRVWVREAHYINGMICPEEPCPPVIYRADPLPCWEGEEHEIRWRPSIHMPRWASRITLEIVSVRVEQLQDISNEDAVAEGIGTPLDIRYAALDEFKPLWESINGAGSWAANPWVWVIEFKRLEASQ